MSLRGLFTILMALMLLTASAWMTGTFNRLRKVSKQYKTEDVFVSACHFTATEVRTGLITGSISIGLSLLLILVAIISYYSN